MPTLIRERVLTLQWSDVQTPEVRETSDGSRSAGVHVSGVLSHVARTIGVLKSSAGRRYVKQTVEERMEEEMPLNALLGLAWERKAAALKNAELRSADTPTGLIWQPGEETRGGVSGNCDGVYLVEEDKTLMGDRTPGNAWALWECKSTMKKTRVGEEVLREWYWMRQIMAYIALYRDFFGSGASVWCDLWVLYLVGNYAGGGMELRSYLLQVERKEAEQVWEMVQREKGAEGVRRE